MSKSSIFGTFQISTDQVYIQNQAPGESVQIEIGDEQIRVDNSVAQQKPPHFRAVQLNEFTQWLGESNQVSPTPQTNAPNPQPISKSTQHIAKPAVPTTPSPQQTKITQKPKRTFRVDAPATRQHAIAKGPNFKTENYVADPQDIAKTLSQLKADGRIIGDMHQTTEPAQQPQSIQRSFKWPQVTNQLTGSGAISELEKCIQSTQLTTNKHIAVCSSDSGSGATTVLLSLARHLSLKDRKILIVDANVSNAVLASRLEIHDHSSWIQSLSQRKALTEVIIKDSDSNVDLLPLITIKQVNWPRKSLKELSKIISSISYDYDFVLFDTGSVEQFVRESEAPSNIAGFVILVTNVSDKNSVNAKNILASTNPNNVVVVENFSQSESMRSKVG